MELNNRFIDVIKRLFLLVLLLELTNGQEDSLQSALNAIDRRQRDLSDYSRYDEFEYGYPMERPEDMAFLKSNDIATDRAFMDYLNDDYDRAGEEDLKKRISSSFRERLEEDKQKQLQEIARNFVSNLENEGEYSNDNSDEYDELLRDLWEKYQQEKMERPGAYLNSDINKRYYYPRFGLDGIGLRKRGRYFNVDGPDDPLYLLNYVPRDEILNRMQEEKNDDDIDSSYIKSRYYPRDNRFNNKYHQYGYNQIKRFPVSKRSPDLKEIHEEKRSTNRKQTDPKVEKDLSSIFGTVKSTQITTTTKQPEITTIPTKIKSTNKKKVSKEKNGKIIKGIEKPLQIKKKSINWSDYFGLDRRKKFDRNDLDKEWLLERYHKAMAMASKRSNEYPFESKKENTSPEEKRIDEMDSKIKSMEDKIVDDALKYTGAHEGATDTKEIQEVKDEVISRLATAFNMEKMRTALGEYKLAVAKERERLKHQRPPIDDYLMAEDKRTSVPRKQAIDEERENVPEGDNNIKCAHASEDCHEQNYPTPNEILENHFGNGICPAIQRTCNEVALGLEPHGRLFEKICNLHQMCLLCTTNSWFSPVGRCKELFLEKSSEVCKGNRNCIEDAERAANYLSAVFVTLEYHAQIADECESACPSEADKKIDFTDSR